MHSGPADLQKCLRSRSHFLRRLRRPRQKRELTRELEESRSTVDRALRELEDAGFVKRDESGYRTTLTGELALAEYERFTTRIDGLAEFHDALATLPTDEPLDAALFEDADVSFPTQRSPHEPVEALAAVLADADHVRMFAPAVIPQYVDIYYERVVEGDMTAEFVLSEGVVEWLVSRRQESVMSIVEIDGVSVAETTTDRAFSLVLVERESDQATDGRHEGNDHPVGVSASDASGGSTDERSKSVGVSLNDVKRGSSDERSESVGVMLYDRGTLLGFVHNDTREAVTWGEAVFDRLADEAVPLGVSAEH